MSIAFNALSVSSEVQTREVTLIGTGTAALPNRDGSLRMRIRPGEAAEYGCQHSSLASPLSFSTPILYNISDGSGRMLCVLSCCAHVLGRGVRNFSAEGGVPW